MARNSGLRASMASAAARAVSTRGSSAKRAASGGGTESTASQAHQRPVGRIAVEELMEQRGARAGQSEDDDRAFHDLVEELGMLLDPGGDTQPVAEIRQDLLLEGQLAEGAQFRFGVGGVDEL